MAQNTKTTLYGSVPEKSSVVLLLIDVINDLDFPGNEDLLRHALPMAKRLARVKQRAKTRGYSVIYVNDNFGRWRSDFKSLVRHCLEDKVPGAEIVKILQPAEDDYFVLKPAHSGFFSSSLEILLKHLEAETLIITGIAANICVLFTANDAFLRGYQLCIPRDCVVANSVKLSRDALCQMKTVLKAQTPRASHIPWDKWHKETRKRSIKTTVRPPR